MSTLKAQIFVGVLLALLVYARWDSDRKFPAVHVIAVLMVIGLALAITYGAVSVGNLAPTLAKFWQIVGKP